MYNSNHFTTKRLCINAVLIAIFVVLDFVSVPIGNVLKLSFSAFPMLLAAMCFGLADGLIVGGLGELVYQIIAYGIGPTTALWMLPILVHAFIVGLYSNRHDHCLSYKQTGFIVFIAGFIASFVTTGCIWLDSKYWGYNAGLTYVVMGFRLLSALIMSVIYTAVAPKTIDILRKACRLEAA